MLFSFLYAFRREKGDFEVVFEFLKKNCRVSVLSNLIISSLSVASCRLSNRRLPTVKDLREGWSGGVFFA